MDLSPGLRPSRSRGALLLALALFAAACGADSGDDTVATPTTELAAEPAAEETAAPAPEPTDPITPEPVATDPDPAAITTDETEQLGVVEPDEAEARAEPEPTVAADETVAAGEVAAEPESGTATEAVPAATATPDVTPAPTPDGVANADYLGSYTLVDEAFGTIVTVEVYGATRTIESNTLPNHQTGTFPNQGNPNTISEQDRSWELTTNPIVTGSIRNVRETGVALNGVKFEPGTGESVSCSSGEQYRIEGLQDTFDLGMDFNNAHVQPTGEYHYHGVSELLVEAFENAGDLVLVGFAADGHLMYYSKSGAYDSSYQLTGSVRTGTDCDYRGTSVAIDGTAPDGTYVSDWSYVDGLGDLDQCNGTVIDGVYAYLVTEEYPFIPRCLVGEVPASAGGGGGAGGGGAGGGGGQGAPPQGGGQGAPPQRGGGQG